MPSEKNLDQKAYTNQSRIAYTMLLANRLQFVIPITHRQLAHEMMHNSIILESQSWHYSSLIYPIKAMRFKELLISFRIFLGCQRLLIYQYPRKNEPNSNSEVTLIHPISIRIQHDQSTLCREKAHERRGHACRRLAL